MNVLRRPVWVALLLALAVLAVYRRVGSHGYVNFDSTVYVADNPIVRAGLTREGVAWAFTTFEAANWHPLTWLSLMLDFELFGPDPGRHHLVSVGMHALSSALLLLALHGMTGSLWPSTLAAALFALHPLRVEPVVWEAQRKDVLSTLFLVAAIWSYARYARAPAPRRLAPVLAWFALGLLSKPMLVSVPCLLLTLDRWPLGRVGQVGWRRLLLEKLPFAALAAAVAWATVAAQASRGAVATLESHGLGLRAANAATACVTYLWKTLAPVDLAVFYPYPQAIPWTRWLPAAVALALISLGAFRERVRWPFLAFGWSWFLVSLLPVIGLIQVGRQALADRYAYVPHIGLLTGIAFALDALARARPAARPWLAGACGAALIALAMLTTKQVDVWSSSTRLYEHALSVTERNAPMHFNLAGTLFGQGDYAGALAHYEEVLELDPGYRRAHYGAGAALSILGHFDRALAHFEREVQLFPGDPQAHNRLGGELYRRSDLPRAAEHFVRGADLDPTSLELASNAATVLLEAGRFEEARGLNDRALALDPVYPPAVRNAAVLERASVP